MTKSNLYVTSAYAKVYVLLFTPMVQTVTYMLSFTPMLLTVTA